MDPEILSPVVVRMYEGRSGGSFLMAMLGALDNVHVPGSHPFEERELNKLLRYAEAIAGVEGSDMGAFSTSTSRLRTSLLQRAFRRLPAIGVLGGDRARFADDVFASLWSTYSTHTMSLAPRLRFYAEKGTLLRDDDVQSLVRSFEDVRTIGLLRDPRDIFASILAFDRRRGTSGFGRLPEHSAMRFARAFSARVRRRFDALLRDLESTDSLVLPYSELVTSPQNAHQHVASWLGSSIRPDTALHRLNPSSHRTSSGGGLARHARDLPPALATFLTSSLSEPIRLHDLATKTGSASGSHLLSMFRLDAPTPAGTEDRTPKSVSSAALFGAKAVENSEDRTMGR